MLSKLIVAGMAIAAATLIAAPIASADELTNAEVMKQGNNTEIWPPTEQPETFPYADGINTPAAQPWIYSGPDCQPVMGTWDDSGFHPDPTGTQVAYGSDAEHLKKHPYKTGLH